MENAKTVIQRRDQQPSVVSCTKQQSVSTYVVVVSSTSYRPSGFATWRPLWENENTAEMRILVGWSWKLASSCFWEYFKSCNLCKWWYCIFQHYHHASRHRHFQIITFDKNSCKQIDLQKTIEIEQVFVPSQYLEGAGNHICRAPNALKTP